MSPNEPEEVDSNRHANSLLPLVYRELHRLAVTRIQREIPGNTLSPTALVHEAYLRIVDVANPGEFNDKSHLFGAAARAMSRILVERVRAKNAVRRGGDYQRVDLVEEAVASRSVEDDVASVREALDILAKSNPEMFRLIELKYFEGLTLCEASAQLGISVRTAHRHVAFVKDWLKMHLTEDHKPDSGRKQQ